MALSSTFEPLSATSNAEMSFMAPDLIIDESVINASSVLPSFVTPWLTDNLLRINSSLVKSFCAM